MKILSDYPELKGQVFDSVDACATEEAKVDKAREKAKEAEAKKATEAEAAKAAVEVARKNLIEARKAITATRVEANKIVEDAQKKAAEMMEPVYANCHKAQEELRKALATYNSLNAPRRVVVNHVDDEEFKQLLKLVFGDLID